MENASPQGAPDPVASRATEEEVVPARPTPYLFVLILLLGFAGFFDSFATSFRYRMITYVREDFQVELSLMTGLFTWVFLGSCLAFVPRLLADVIGRRLVLWGTMAALGIVQWLISFARTPYEYVGLLTMSAIFYKADIWILMLSEEAPPRYRATWASFVVAISAVGTLVLGEMVSTMGPDPGGWRAVSRFGLYGLALSFPVLLLTRETHAFRNLTAKRARIVDWTLLTAPLRPPHLRSLVVVTLLKMLLGGGAIMILAIVESDFLRVDNGVGTEMMGRLIFGDMAATVSGWFFGGLAGDRLGRHRATYLFGAIWVASLLGFALLPRGSTAVLVLSVLHNFGSTAVFALLRILAVELFPVQFRSTASAWSELMMTLFAAAMSAMLSALLRGTLLGHSVSLATVIVGIACAIPFVMLLYRLLPETQGRRLDVV